MLIFCIAHNKIFQGCICETVSNVLFVQIKKELSILKLRDKFLVTFYHQCNIQEIVEIRSCFAEVSFR